MKKIMLIFLLGLIVFPMLLNAQVKIQAGDPYGVIDAKTKSYIRRGNDLLTVKISGKKVHIQKLNCQSLSLIKQNTYDDLPDGFLMEDIQMFNSRCYFFYSYWVKGEQKEQLYYREIDFNNAAFIGKDVLLLSEDSKIDGTLISGGFYNFSVVDKFDFFTSYDSSKMVVQYRMKPLEKRDAKNYDLIGLRVYGRNMEPVWGDLIDMPYTEKKMNNLDYSVDSDGNAWILATVYDDNTTDIKKEKDGDANYHIELLKVTAFTKKIEKSVITLQDKFINTVWLYEGPDNMMFCAGFYNIGKSLDNANGIVMFKINKEGGVYDMKSYEIPVEVLNMYVSAATQARNEKKDEKGKAEFENLELREFIIENDGSIILIGEQHYITESTTYTSNGTRRTTYTYHFNDILVTKIDANGKLAWMKKLPKRQTASSSNYMPKYKGGMSYALIYGTGGYYILFLDNAKNLNLPPDKVPARHSDGMGGFLTSYKINSASGQTNKTSIFDVRDVEGMSIFQLSMDRLIQSAVNEFVMEAYKKGKEDILIRVKLE